MGERFSGSVLNGDGQTGESVLSLGEIGLNAFSPYLMNRVMARYNANLAEELKHLGMSTAKVRTLAVLSVISSATINELSVLAVVEQSTMSRTLDSLEEQGYIRRQSRDKDMRVRDVSITEEGRVAFDAAWPTMHSFVQQMFEGIDEDEQRAFVTTLQKMLRNVRVNEI